MSPMIRRPPGIELALLGILKNGPQHGYQIHQTVSDQNGLGLIWHLKQSQLYALLSKLENDGHLTSEIQSQDPHPPRRVFRITPIGETALSEWLSSPSTVPHLVRQELLAKLYFLQDADNEAARLLMKKQENLCRHWLGNFIQKAARCAPGTYQWLIYQYRISQIEATITWLDFCQYTAFLSIKQ